MQREEILTKYGDSMMDALDEWIAENEISTDDFDEWGNNPPFKGIALICDDEGIVWALPVLREGVRGYKYEPFMIGIAEEGNWEEEFDIDEILELYR